MKDINLGINGWLQAILWTPATSKISDSAYNIDNIKGRIWNGIYVNTINLFDGPIYHQLQENIES